MFWLYFENENKSRYQFNSMVELMNFVMNYDMGIIQHHNMTVQLMNAPICKLSVWNNKHSRNDIGMYFLDENFNVGGYLWKY